MSSTRLTSYILVISAFLIAFLLFFIFDFFWGEKFSIENRILSDKEKPYLMLKHGWYELKRNFDGEDQFGSLIYVVETDKFGFRKSQNTPTQEKNEILFLGDSFTYGINGPWSETFVGMFASKTGRMVLNGGVSSYSPTAYLYQYKKALKENSLTENHTIIIGIDISDVQDEASYWTWNEKSQPHPRRIKLNSIPESNENKNVSDLQQKKQESFPLTKKIYTFVRHDFWAKPKIFANLTKLPRSAFTWEDWVLLNETNPNQNPNGYAPLGVEGGLEKVRKQISKINELAKKNNSKVYFLIYPWPAQIVHADKFDWSKWVQDLCKKEKCAGVIDTIPYFRSVAKKNKNWYSDYYVTGDIHFNKLGNQVIFEHLLKGIALK